MIKITNLIRATLTYNLPTNGYISLKGLNSVKLRGLSYRDAKLLNKDAVNGNIKVTTDDSKYYNALRPYLLIYME